MSILSNTVIIVVTVVLIILILQNGGQKVDVYLFNKEFQDVKLFVVMLVSFGAGAIIMGFLSLISEWSLKLKLSKKEKEISKVKQELENIRYLTLEEREEEN